MKLADVAIKRPVLATVMVGTLLVFGAFSYPRIGVDLFPNVEFPVVTISAVYPGADPETVETKVVDPLEEAVNSVSGIKVLSSKSMENFGQVIVQFELERHADQAVQDVRDKVSSALRLLPKDLDPPVVAKFDMGSSPVVVVVVSGKKTVLELTQLADNVVKQRLQTIMGVGGIDIVGGRDREFQVWIDPLRLDAKGLTVFDVVGSLQSQNVELPGGRMNIGNLEFVVKTRGEVHSAQGLSQIIISSRGGVPVRIGDVARVEDGVQEARSHSSLSGVSAVSLVVRKQSGSNTVEVAAAVTKAVKKLAGRLPAGFSLQIPIDNSTYIKHAINDVQFDLVFGALLAVFIIMFFLHDWRATFISALAIPTSLVATFAFADYMGFTFNNMTMLALSLSIGILVDDAIVVIEAIHRQVELGHNAMKAASLACEEIGLAVVATTLSIAAVFIPVAFMKGIIGRFFLQFGLTVAFAVLVSLFVAFTLTPMLAARMLREHKKKNLFARGIDGALRFVENVYRRLLKAALRRRFITMVLASGIFVGSCSLMKIVPVEFMPPEDRGEFMVKVELPTGTDLATTSMYIELITADIRNVPGVDLTFTTIGAGAAAEVNKADVQVNLVGRNERAFSQEEMMAFMRGHLKKFSEAQISVELIPMVGGAGFRAQLVQFNIRGTDYEELNEAAGKLVEEMRKSGGYVDLDSSYRGGKPELKVEIDRDRAADFGVPIQAIAATLRTFIAGDKATEIGVAGTRYDVRVRLPDRQRSRPELIGSFRVRSNNGMLVPLSSIVSVSRGSGAAMIERQNRQRQVTVLANLEGKPLGAAVKEVDALAAKVVPSELTTGWMGMGEIMVESFQNMVLALVLAIILIYLILAAQFESFIHPLTIMFSLPLAVVGALGGLAIAGMSMNIFSMIGIIMLMGLVTKNAILLVDFTNILRRRGQSVNDALVEAGVVRMRPILMTSLATIFGMLPVALALSEGGEVRAPMAVAAMGGMTTSTFLTLIVVPVVYSLFEGGARRMRKLFGRPIDGASFEGEDLPAES